MSNRIIITFVFIGVIASIAGMINRAASETVDCNPGKPKACIEQPSGPGGPRRR
jgi:hypothetical protein